MIQCLFTKKGEIRLPTASLTRTVRLGVARMIRCTQQASDQTLLRWPWGSALEIVKSAVGVGGMCRHAVPGHGERIVRKKNGAKESHEDKEQRLVGDRLDEAIDDLSKGLSR